MTTDQKFAIVLALILLTIASVSLKFETVTLKENIQQLNARVDSLQIEIQRIDSLYDSKVDNLSDTAFELGLRISTE